MKFSIPKPIRRYLATCSTKNRCMAYFRLSHDKCINLSGGNLVACGVTAVDKSRPIDEQLDSLVGLLPVQNHPVVISNAQTKHNLFVDMHIFSDSFSDSNEQWVVLFDNTKAAMALQVKQQERLRNDIKFERCN